MHRLPVLLSVVVLGVTACIEGDPAATGMIGATTTAPLTATARAEDELAVRKLAEGWHLAEMLIYQRVISPGDARGYLTDEHRAEFLTRLNAFAATGHRREESPRSRHVIERIEVEPGRAVVDECVVDADLVVDAEGWVVDDEIVTRRSTSVATRTDAGWRFASRETRSETVGRDLCRDQV